MHNTLAASDYDISLNGELLEANVDGTVGELTPETVANGWFEFPPTSIAFVVDEAADVSVCP